MIRNIIFSSLSSKVKICILGGLLFFTNVLASENILVIRPLGVEYKNIEKGIKAYFNDNYNIVPLVNCNTANCLKQSISKNSPIAIVAMSNDMIYNLKKSSPTIGSSIPVYSVLKSYSPSNKYKIKNSNILNTETPFTVYINKLKSDLKVDVKKIGIIHSDRYSTFKIDEYIGHTNKNRIQVFKKLIITSDNIRNLEKNIKNALSSLCKENQVDAVMIINDSRMLSNELVSKVWKPISSQCKLPIIVPSKAYISGPLGFGTIAISANNKITGEQIGYEINKSLKSKTFGKKLTPISYKSYLKNVMGNVTASDINFGHIPAYVKSSDIIKEVPEKETAENENTNQENNDTVTTAYSEDVKSKNLTSNSTNTYKPTVNTRKTSQPQNKIKKNVPKKIKKLSKINQELIKTEGYNFTGKYIEIIVTASQVFKNDSNKITYIGTVKKGELYPLLEETQQNYKIQFFSQVGLIEKNSGKIIVNVNNNPFSNTIIIISAASALILLIIVIIFILVFSKRKKIKIPNQPSCLIISSTKKSFKVNTESNKKIKLRKVFTKLGYHVEVTKDLAHVNKVLLYYLPSVICIDWRFTLNIRQIIYNMLSERSFATDVKIIFYNTVNAKTISSKNKFTDLTFYFDDNMTMENIEHALSDEHAIDSYKSLEGKIEKNNLVEIIQLIDNSKKTGCLYIEKDNHPYGAIFIENGVVIYSATDTILGEAAVFNILALNTGMFHFVEGKRPKQNNMSIPVMQILMTHFKHMDETRHQSLN